MAHSLTQSTIEAQVLRMLDLVSYQDGTVVSREVLRKKSGAVTLFAVDEGQGLSEHTAPFDAIANLNRRRHGDHDFRTVATCESWRVCRDAHQSAARTEGKRQIEDAFDHDSVAGLRQAGAS